MCALSKHGLNLCTGLSFKLMAAASNSQFSTKVRRNPPKPFLTFLIVLGIQTIHLCYSSKVIHSAHARFEYVQQR